MDVKNNNLVDYYRGEAIKQAKNINIKIREENDIVLSPDLGSKLIDMPVYEPINNTLKTTLHSFTNRLIPTTIINVSQKPLYIDAFFRLFKHEGKDRAEIVLTDQNPCWTRFFATKEMMHCYLYDCGENKNTTNSTTELKSLIMSIINETGSHADTPDSVVDDAAYYGAVEYLIPTDTIPLIKAVYNTLIANPNTSEKAYLFLATKIRVPESILEFRLNNDDIFNAYLTSSVLCSNHTKIM